MKNFLILFLLFSQISCASSDVRLIRKHKGINSDFLELKKDFIFESKGKVTENDFEDLTMGYIKYPKNDSSIGTCWPMQIITEIDITEEYKDNWDYYWRKELVYHEFGHCILGREHTEPTTSTGFFGKVERLFFKLGLYQPRGYLKDGCPVSLMHPRMVGSFCFSKHYDYYIQEMFANYDPEVFNTFDSDFGFKDESIDWLYIKEVETPFRRPQNLNLSCGRAEIVNKTDTWNKRDQDTLHRAHRTCFKVYDSCLKKFVKVKELAYHAICGD